MSTRAYVSTNTALQDFFLFFFFGFAHTMWDLGSPTRDQTHVPGSGPLDCHGIPQDCFFFFFFS